MIELWICSRLEGRPKMRVETCAALHQRAEKAKTNMARMGIAPCIGCGGIVALNQAEHREPVTIDLSKYKAPRRIPASHGEDGMNWDHSQPVRHRRNDNTRVRMVIEGRLKHG